MIRDLMFAQLTDPFRIVLLAALYVTMRRTQAKTGTWIPLLLGAAFVAAIVPSTMQTQAGDMVLRIATGLVVNLGLLAVILGLGTVWDRVRG